MSYAGTGSIKLADGSELRLRIMIVDIKETGFSPFGGVNLNVTPAVGVAVVKVPEELRKAVADKPILQLQHNLPQDGWEIIDIVEQEPAEAEEVVETSRGRYRVRVVVEAVMVSRNMKYRDAFNEPIYWVYWVLKTSWKPIEQSTVSGVGV